MSQFKGKFTAKAGPPVRVTPVTAHSIDVIAVERDIDEASGNAATVARSGDVQPGSRGGESADRIDGMNMSFAEFQSLPDDLTECNSWIEKIRAWHMPNPCPQVNQLLKIVEERSRQPNWGTAAGAGVTLADVVLVRKILSTEKNPPIDDVISLGKGGLLRRIIALMGDAEQHDDLRFEAAWVVTNVASGDSRHTQLVVDFAAIRPLIELLHTKNEDLIEQAVWCLGNIAGDSPKMRDVVFDSGVVSSLLIVAGALESGEFKKLSLRRNTIWLCSNLCRGKPVPKLTNVLPLMDFIAATAYGPDEEARSDALWALSYISDGDDARITAVIAGRQSHIILPVLIAELQSKQSALVTPALRCLGNAVTGSNDLTDIVLQAGLLKHLAPLLRHPKRAIVKETCWTLSNVTAGSPQQVAQVLDPAFRLLPLLLDCFTSNHTPDVQKEAAWAISNAVTSGDPDERDTLIRAGVVRKAISVLKTVVDTRTIAVVLEMLASLVEETPHGEIVRAWVIRAHPNITSALLQHSGKEKADEILALLGEEVDEEASDGDFDESSADESASETSDRSN